MKFIVAVISIHAIQASASVLDDMRGILKPLELNVEKLVTNVASDLQETIDCTIMAVNDVLSLGGMLVINPEHKRRCEGVLKEYGVTPQDTQQTDTRTAHLLQIIKEIARGNEDTTNSIIKNETDRVFVISRMIRQELDHLSAETKSEFNIHDIDLEHVSVQQVLKEIGALYKVQQSGRSGSQANEIRHLFDKILEILQLNTGGRVYSDDDEVNEIFKNLQQQENDALIDIAKQLSVWRVGDSQENTTENVKKLQSGINNIRKIFRDIVNKIFNQGNTNDLRRSNTSDIMNSLDKTTAARIQNVDVRKNFQDTANRILEELKLVDTNQMIKPTKRENIFTQSTNPYEKYYITNRVQARVDDIFKDSEKEYQDIDITKSFQDAASQIMVDSQLEDPDQIVKSTEEATNLFSQPNNQQKRYYNTNGVQENGSDKFKDPGKENQNVNVAKIFQDAASQIMVDSKPVDTDQVVKSTEEANKIFSQPTNQQEKSYDTNRVQESGDDMFKDPAKENQNINVAKVFQDAASEITVDSKPVDTDQIVKSTEEASKIFSRPTNQQEKSSDTNSVQASGGNIIKPSEREPQKVNVAKVFQDAASEIMENSEPVDTDQIVKSTEEAINNREPDQHQNWHCFQENLTNMLKASESDPYPSEPGEGLNNIDVNAPTNQNDNVGVDRDDMSFFSHLFSK